MATVLALDFDGVLHPDGCSSDHEFCRLHALEAALRELPSMPTIVISSSWRFDTDLESLRALFSPDVGRQIAGVTPNINGPVAFAGRGCRQREIEAWMAEHAPEDRWIALDDQTAGFDAGCAHLISTNRGLGVQFDELETLKRLLSDGGATYKRRSRRP